MIDGPQLAIAAEAAEAAGCGFDCDISPGLKNTLEFLLVGAVPLPIALSLIWLLHRVKRDRLVILNAVLVAVGSCLFLLLMEIIGFNAFSYMYEMVTKIGLNPAPSVTMPALIVSFLGAFAFGSWLKRSQREQGTESLE